MDSEYNETMSRQRRYQLRKIKQGLCTICGKNKAYGKSYCPDCTIKRRKRVQEKEGFSPKKEGGRGRPTIY